MFDVCSCLLILITQSSSRKCPTLVKTELVLPCFIFISDILKKGLSFGSTPGVLFSNGATWSEMRRTSLHTLKNLGNFISWKIFFFQIFFWKNIFIFIFLGFGKNILEDIVDDSVDNLIEHIDRNYLDKPIDVIRSLELLGLSILHLGIFIFCNCIEGPSLGNQDHIWGHFRKKTGTQ